jgi:IS30 family transposase
MDRQSRFTHVTKLTVRTAQESCVPNRQLAERPQYSLTAGIGSEQAEHEQISQILPIGFFLCCPCHSWEKGSVEPVPWTGCRARWPKGQEI